MADVNGGHAAADLGIAQSVAGSTLTGSDVFQVSSDVPLTSLNDGNGLRLRTGAADLTISLADGSKLNVNLDNSFTIGDVVNKINQSDSNGGKLTAALQDGRLQLTDNTAGSGTLSVTSPTGSNAAHVLGLAARPAATCSPARRSPAG